MQRQQPGRLQQLNALQQTAQELIAESIQFLTSELETQATPSDQVLLDRLYMLLDQTIKDVLESTTKVNLQSGDLVVFNTSLIATFLNRCHISFKQMMFENVSELKGSMTAYLQAGPASTRDYEYPLAPMYYEQWVSEKANKIEQEAMHQNADKQIAEISAVT